MVENANDAIVLIRDQTITYANPRFLELSGYTLEALSVIDFAELVHPDDYETVNGRYHRRMNGEEVIGRYSYRMIDKQGAIRWVDVRPGIITLDGVRIMLVLISDITDQKKAEEQIKASLKEKETLLQEIHHRVKNNLAVVSSLLGLQSEKSDDMKLKEALMDSRNRINAMSMIHEVLYESESLSRIDMKAYLLKLSSDIARSYENSSRVQIHVEADGVRIGAKQASPVGLIVNEMMTNSFKYAFREKQEGKIRIQMKEVDSHIELIYADDGVGIAEDIDWTNADSMGLRLIKILSEGQLKGSLQLTGGKGTCFKVKFARVDENRI